MTQVDNPQVGNTQVGNTQVGNQVLVTPHLLQSDEGPHVEPLREAGLEIVYPPSHVNTLEPAIIRELLTPHVVAMLASTEPLSREILAASQLKVVARMGVGYDAVDVSAATDFGIAVTITPGTLEDSVAEQTLALLLAVTRGVIGRDQEVRGGDWKRVPLPRLAGRTFGIVGCGRIGRAMIPRAQGLLMDVLVHDPFLLADVPLPDGVRRIARLEELLTQADVVSLHLPCTPGTEKLISAETLALMRPQAILLNTSRGGLVDEDALCDALAAGRLFGAGLDVFQQEPLPSHSRLLTLNNVVLSSHTGGIDEEMTRRAGRLAAECIQDLKAGRWPTQCVVNRDLEGRFDWQTPRDAADQ